MTLFFAERRGRSLKSWVFILAWGGTCVPAVGAAVEPSSDADAVIVRARADDATAGARDATPFATVLHTAQAPTLGTVLVESPGADVRRTGGHREELQLRGAGAGQLAVFLDDVPLTGARGGAFDLSLVPPDVLDRVEVFRGPNAATWGGGALGGVLHLHTRPVGPGRARAAALRLGQYGETGLSVAEAWGGERADVLAVLGAAHGDGDFVFEDVQGETRRRRNNTQDELHGLARGRLRVGDDTTLTLLLLGTDTTRGEPGVEQFEQTRAHAARGQLLAAVAADDDTLFGDRFEGGVSAHFTRRTDAWRDPAPTLWGAPTRSDLDDRSVGGRARLGLKGLNAWGAHRPRVAVEARHEWSRSRLEAAYEPDRDDDRTSTAVVLSESWSPWADHLVLSGAVRVDDHDGRDAMLVPQAGAALTPFAPLTLRGNVGRVFRDPSFDELYYRGPGVRGDPHLRPEDGLAWDAGLELRPARGVSLQAAAFGQRYDRVILFMPVQAYLIEATDNHGARIFGQEAAADARFGPGRLTLAYTHLDARFDAAPRTPLPHRPAHRLFGRLQGHVGRAVAFLAADTRAEVRTDRFGYRRIPGHTLWDLGVTGPVGAGFDAGLTFRNIFDVKDAQDAVQQPLPGRTWLFSLRFSPAGEVRGEERP